MIFIQFGGILFWPIFFLTIIINLTTTVDLHTYINSQNGGLPFLTVNHSNVVSQEYWPTSPLCDCNQRFIHTMLLHEKNYIVAM